MVLVYTFPENDLIGACAGRMSQSEGLFAFAADLLEESPPGFLIFAMGFS